MPMAPISTTPMHGKEDYESILSQELLAHRSRLRDRLDEWSYQQEQIFERALNKLHAGSTDKEYNEVISTSERVPYCSTEASSMSPCSPGVSEIRIEGACNHFSNGSYNSTNGTDPILPSSDCSPADSPGSAKKSRRHNTHPGVPLRPDPLGLYHIDSLSEVTNMKSLSPRHSCSKGMDNERWSSQHSNSSDVTEHISNRVPRLAKNSEDMVQSEKGPTLWRSHTSDFSTENIRSQAAAFGFVRKKTSGLSLQRAVHNLKELRDVKKILAAIVFSKRFESTCATVILFNAVLLGMSSDYAMSHIAQPEHPTMAGVEFGFTCFYFVEVNMRMIVIGCEYFKNADWRWNWFDLALVIMSAWDLLESRVQELQSGSAMKNLSFLRMLRLMKMLKLLRMIRLMRMFRELRLILHSVLGCVQAMFWAMVLILTISYMFGICFLQACTSYYESEGKEAVSPSTQDAIDEHWSSVGSSMLSLYMAATAGKEWSVLAAPLREVGFIFYLLFLVYIAFFAFVVMNTVTGLFIEATMQNSEKDQQMIIQMELEKKGQYIDKLQAFYDEMDDDQDGEISFEEFSRHVNTPEMRAFARSLEIDVLDAKQFFCILSDHGRRSVDVETFVVGCIKLKGAARSMDLMDLVYAFRDADNAARAHQETVVEMFDTVDQSLKQTMKVLSRLGSKSKSHDRPSSEWSSEHTPYRGTLTYDERKPNTSEACPALSAGQKKVPKIDSL